MEDLLRILFKWAKPIGILTAAAAVLSSIVSLVLPEYFQSTATFLVGNPYMMERGSLFKREAGDNPVYLFGGEYDMNRVISLAESSGLSNYLVKKFNLYKQYDIDTTDALKEYYVKEELNDHFKIQKTPEGMLLVAVTDTDKQFAAIMANDIVQRLDEMNLNITTEKKRDLTSIYEKGVTEKRTVLTQLTDSLHNAIRTNPRDTVTAKIIGSMVKDALADYNNVKAIYDEHTASLNQKVSTFYIVETAQPALRRYSPVRWLVVLSSTLIALVAGILGVLVFERFKNFHLNEETSAKA